MSDRQTLQHHIDLHSSIVRPDGSVPPVDARPIAGWKNAGSAARGASEYRDDQPAGVVNSRQAAQGSIVDAGVAVRHADPHTPGNCQPGKPRARFDDRRGCWVLHQQVA